MSRLLFFRTALTCIITVVFLHAPGLRSDVTASETSVLKGSIHNAGGEAVRGAMVFAYTDRDVRRSADFISAPADSDGMYRMVMPPGDYWLVARLKKSEGFGPLMPGDMHSGDPVEIELLSGSDVDMDFVVADLKDAIRMKREARERPVRISGRIIDEKGEPVTGAYAVAYKNGVMSRIPDYLSAWVDQEGRYILYLPEGTYTLGGALTFPPAKNHPVQGEISAETDKSDVHIIIQSTEDR